MLRFLLPEHTFNFDMDVCFELSDNETITSAYKYARKVLEWYASK
jgi:hypothetical protein